MAMQQRRARAVEMPPGHEREIVLQQLCKIQMTSGLADWTNSPGLQPPS
jgi:hypothetical protein